MKTGDLEFGIGGIGFDDAWIEWIQGWISPPLTEAMQFASWIGGGLPVVVWTAIIGALLWLFTPLRKEIIGLFAIGVISMLINEFLKGMVGRERPDGLRLIEAEGLSFPSGHAMNAVSLYLTVLIFVWPLLAGRRNWRIALAVVCTTMILWIGISRIYLGVHYPTDVLGGWMCGAIWVMFSTTWIRERFGANGNSSAGGSTEDHSK